ncbi:MAG: formate dehydrogenase accessory sulfurtransferase FdhD [Propionibacteriales bacterium]|nr:formate dehydrogenase accessory sulfurtransferase FdhD [Propionibacteriales bacterium]
MSPTTRPGPVGRRTVVEVVDGNARQRPDSVVTEEPLEIRLAWPARPAQRVAVTMRTPGADFELATGFLLSEGVLPVGQPPRSVGYCADRDLRPEQRLNVVVVTLRQLPLRVPGRRTTQISSACGVCGAESLDDVFSPDEPPVPLTVRHDPRRFPSYVETLLTYQPLFARTGSIHAAGVFDARGELVVAREDVGRHNTVDKVLGARQLGTVGYDESAVLCVSGRIGFDIVSKAVAGRVGTIVGVGGPSSLALALADRAGVTVCGFTRGQRTVAYTHPERLLID